MNKTDSPLKRLVQMAPQDFAEWLLGKKVATISSANIEIQPQSNATYTDLVFWVTLDESDTATSHEDSDEQENQAADDRLLLHIEFQGPSSERPMRFRVLDY